MLLTPHYGDDPLVTIDGDPAAIAAPLVRQRRWVASTLAAFTDEQWSHPSRCEGWSARDVLVHLDGTNAFWTLSLAAGLRGEPTRFLATFDPVTSPATSVAQSRDQTPTEVLARFTESTEALARLVESFDPADWTVLAEAPPGHLAASVVAHHALWDSWIHERDILLPLGIWLILRFVPADVLADGRARAAEAAERPVSRGAAAVIVAIWLVLVGLSAWLLYGWIANGPPGPFPAA